MFGLKCNYKSKQLETVNYNKKEYESITKGEKWLSLVSLILNISLVYMAFSVKFSILSITKEDVLAV